MPGSTGVHDHASHCPHRVGIVSVAVDVHTADAQDNRLYAGVSGMWSTQGSMPLGSDPDMPTTGVGGTAFVFSVWVRGSSDQPWVSAWVSDTDFNHGRKAAPASLLEMRLDVEDHVTPYVDQEIPMVYVPAGTVHVT
jgi:hypothetical protein